MRLVGIQKLLDERKMKYDYSEEDDCGSIDFLYRGLSYHIWEYQDDVRGAETNVFSCGRSIDLEGDYEEQIIKEIKGWPAE